MITTFRDTKNRNDHQAFLEWTEKSTNGYFINFITANDMMLHRSERDHIIFKPKEEVVSLTAKMKVCSTDKEELETLVREENPQATLKYCSSCKPI